MNPLENIIGLVESAGIGLVLFTLAAGCLLFYNEIQSLGSEYSLKQHSEPVSHYEHKTTFNPSYLKALKG